MEQLARLGPETDGVILDDVNLKTDYYGKPREAGELKSLLLSEEEGVQQGCSCSRP